MTKPAASRREGGRRFEDPSDPGEDQQLLPVATAALGVAWTLVLGLSFFVAYREESRTTLEFARLEARASVDKDMLYRHWIGNLGGVYARVTNETLPNPYLTDSADRDLKTVEGVRLTLINAAYMNRQVHDLGLRFGIGSSHLTSLLPKRPENAADQWESNALQHVEHGEQEFSSREHEGSQVFLRYMRAMVIDRSCLTCHVSEGYREGELHGGMSISVDVAPFQARSTTHILRDVYLHAGLWLVGLCGLGGGHLIVLRRIRDRDVAAARVKAVEIELADFYEHAPDMFLLMESATGRILTCNETLLERTGLTREAIIGRPLSSICHPRSVSRIDAAMEQFGWSGEIRQLEFDLPVVGDRVLEVELNATAVLAEKGHMQRIRAVLRDITQRKAAEQEIRRLNQLSATLSEVNQSINRSQTREEVFAEVCRVAVVFGGFKAVWIGYLDRAAKRVVAVSKAGDADGFSQSLSVGPDDLPEASGLVGLALKEGRSCVTQDAMHDPRLMVWQHFASVHTLRAGAALPIHFGGVLWGFLSVYANEADVLRDREIAMLEEMAMDISFGLEQLRQTELRREADAALRASEAQLAAAQRIARVGSWWRDLATGEVSWSGEMYRIFGTSPDEFQPSWERELRWIHPEDRDRVARVISACVASGQGYELEYRIHRPDASERHVHVIGQVDLDADDRAIRTLGVAQDITERRESEAALRASEERFRMVLQDAPSVAIQGYGPDGTAQYWNHASERLYGYTAEEAIGRNLLDLIVPEDLRDEFREVMRGMAEASRPISSGEWQLMRKDGSRVAVFSSHALVMPPGRPAEFFCIDVDLTELKRTEAALRRRERILAAVCFAAERFLMVADWRKSITDLLMRLGEAAHVSRAVLFEVRDGPDGDLLMSQTGEWAMPGLPLRTDDPTLKDIPVRAGGFGRWADLLIAGQVVRGNTREFPDSEQPALTAHRIISIVVVPVLVGGCWWGFLAFDECMAERVWDSGEVESLQAAANILGEAIERQAAEETLGRLTSQKEMILNSAGEGIMGLDSDGNHTFANPAAARMLGYEIADLLGLPSHSTWHHSKPDGHSYPQSECPVHAAFRDGIVRRRNDEVFWRKDGSSFPVEYVSTPILEEDTVVGAVLTFNDITGRKHLEAQLRQAQKMEAVGQLAGGVAHDFNNILAATMLNLNMLQQAPSIDDEVRKSLRELETDIQRAANLTRQLLLFSRRSVMQVQPIDVNSVVENLLKMLRRLIGEQITLEWLGKQSLPPVSGDAGMLEQVVMNLVVNSRDAMPAGGRITIATELVEITPEQARSNNEARPGRFVRLTVGDTGCGMDEKVLRRLFEPFFTTKEAGKGTGLGLATVYGITKQHRGWVGVDSQPGRGSTFSVFVPALAGESGGPGSEASAPPARGGREVILLVEDEAGLRKSVGSILRMYGYRVFEAADGREAIRVWTTHWREIDLLLTDMVMPHGINGLQLADELRSERPELKVLISSGYSADLVHQNDLEGKDMAFIAKPCTARELAAAIRRCIERPVSETSDGAAPQ